MTIHTVKAGETVFRIARDYGTSPIKIIEDNGLLRPDELNVGEELLILTPTRTYNVRGGDTVDKICRRFGVKRQALLASNPALGGTDRIYPGQVLSLRYDKPTGGMVAANGYVFAGCDTETLRAALPYLTYVTVAAGTEDDGQVSFLFDDRTLLSLSHEAGKTVLLRIGMERVPDDFFCDPERQERFLKAATKAAHAHGYDGITLSCFRMTKEAGEAFCQWMMEARRLLLGMNLLLFTETDGNGGGAVSEYADGNVLFYEKCSLTDIPTFEEGEKKVLAEYAGQYESSRTFLDISPFGYAGGAPLTREEIMKIARRYKSEILYDQERQICSFSYPQFGGGRRETRTVVFDSLRNIQHRLDVADEYGYMGIAFDVLRTPIAGWMMFYTTFSPIDYSMNTQDNM